MQRIWGRIGVKFAAIVTLTIGSAAGIGYLSGVTLIEQIARLINDPEVDRALILGARSTIELNKIRKLSAEKEVAGCRKKAKLGVGSCLFAEIRVDQTISNELKQSGWISENEYVFVENNKTYRYTFYWDELKPRYLSIENVLTTRNHLSSIFPSLTESFTRTFALSILSSAILGMIFTYFFGRGLNRRIAILIEYTRRIAKGSYDQVPLGLEGSDEFGILAAALGRMAQELKVTQARLIYAEKVGSWQAVAKKVAHEIKNPLTPIGLVADEIENHLDEFATPLKSIMQQSARIIKEETGSLDRMVREFSAFARLPEPQLERISFEDLVDDFIKRNRQMAGVRFILIPSKDQTFVMADRAMIFQIFHNLVNNAKIAKSSNEVVMTFEIKLFNHDVSLLVSDNGPGIPETIRAHIFDAYVTNRSTGDKERGMGLGLTISRKIASDHGGTLELLSTGEKGSCFELRLPVRGNPNE